MDELMTSYDFGATNCDGCGRILRWDQGLWGGHDRPVTPREFTAGIRGLFLCPLCHLERGER